MMMTSARIFGAGRGLPRTVLLVLWLACIYGLLEILFTTGLWVFDSKHYVYKTHCSKDDEVGGLGHGGGTAGSGRGISSLGGYLHVVHTAYHLPLNC